MKKAVPIYQIFHTIVFSVVFIALDFLEPKVIVTIVAEMVFYTSLFYLISFSMGKIVEKSNKEKSAEIRVKSLIFIFFRAFCVVALIASVIATFAYIYLNNITGVYYREIYSLLIFWPAPLTVQSALKYLITQLDLYHISIR